MEIGEPPLYAEVNKVCRTMDKEYLETLGPFIQSFASVAGGAEKPREEIDQIPTGTSIQKELGKGVDYNMAGMFVLFRGALLEEQWIHEWEMARDQKNYDGDPCPMAIPYYLNCTPDLITAMGQALSREAG